jgi:hypothetical protein
MTPIVFWAAVRFGALTAVVLASPKAVRDLVDEHCVASTHHATTDLAKSRRVLRHGFHHHLRHFQFSSSQWRQHSGDLTTAAATG